MSLSRWILVGILLVAVASRLVGLTTCPPGIHHDEAGNGYDAWSLLKTGQDRWGHDWPVLLEGLGRSDHRGALYAYLCIPFHLLAGADHLIWSTRAPAAVLGVLTILAFYGLVKRSVGESAGLVAAALLAVSPWHLHLSRIGHEATLVPACIVIAMWLGSKWRDGWGYLVAAAVVTALSFYAYSTMRIVTPMLILAGVVCFYRDVLTVLKNPRLRLAVMGAILLAGVIVTPLAIRCFQDPDSVMARTRQVSVFHHPTWTIGEKTERVAVQYVHHFSLDWLFDRGDPYPLQSIRGLGQLNWVLLPLLLVGTGVSLWHCRRSHLHRFLLLWLILYPIPGAITYGGIDSTGVGGVHALRSACGLPVFQWLGAVGFAAISTAIPQRRKSLKMSATSAIAVGVAINGGVCFWQYFSIWSREPWVKALYQDDLVRALKAIRPHWSEFDHVYISVQNDADKRWHSGEPYILTLLTLPVSPADFHMWDKSVDYVRPTDGFHRVGSFGPFVADTTTETMERSFSVNPNQSVIIIARPNEPFPPNLPRITTIFDASGQVRFEIWSNRQVQ